MIAIKGEIKDDAIIRKKTSVQKQFCLKSEQNSKESESRNSYDKT